MSLKKQNVAKVVLIQLVNFKEVKMVSLELFEKILIDIQEHELKNDKLSNIMVCPDCTGWIDYGSNLIDNTLKILNDTFGLPEDDDLIWAWLYELPDGPVGHHFHRQSDRHIRDHPILPPHSTILCQRDTVGQLYR